MPAVTDVDVGLLVQAAAAGDEGAWRHLVDRYVRLVWSVVREFRLGDEISEDIVQTTWLRLAENLDRIREPERVGSWLATTARREAIRTTRKRVQEPPVDVGGYELPADDIDLDLRLIDSEECAAVVRAFHSLGQECRELVRLRALDPPMSYREIAEILSIPIGSIGPKRMRCINKLLAAVRAEGEVRDE
jgi:RNA polymerase sigma factor (sigma-70 family)